MNAHFTLKAIKPVLPYSLHLEYADGQRFDVDLKPIVARHATLKRLREPSIFMSAKKERWGRSVIWIEDDNLELAADNLRAAAIEQRGDYSHEFVLKWMDRNELTLDAAADALGISRRMLAYYRSGEKPIPKTVGLACEGWEMHHLAEA